MRALIYSVLEFFYRKATKDILIGYHFEKFNDPQILVKHLERITSFWEMQLTGTSSAPPLKPFQLLQTHQQLKIKRGELGRWIVLFHQTLAESDDPKVKELSEDWKKRIALFEERFKSDPEMFR